MSKLNTWLHVCCNHPDNGLFTGRAMALNIVNMEFQANDWARGVAFREAPDGRNIRIAGKDWPILRSKEGVGNWCWNAYELGIATPNSPQRVAEFLIWLRRRELFAIEAAPTVIWNWWHRPRSFDLAKLMSAIQEAA